MNVSRFGFACLAALMLIAVVALAACAAQPTPTPVPSTPAPDLVALFRQYMDSHSGDLNETLALLTDDAVVNGMGLCAPSPCVGKDAIRKDIERGLAAHTQHTSFDAQASGNTVTARIGHRNDASRAAGIDQYVVLVTIEFRGGKIASMTRKYDLSDPQTVAYARFQQQQAQPTPTPR
jgi:ketosteroid isomerase-like protein